MDIYQYLNKDHEKISTMMEQMISSGSNRERESLFKLVREELILHAKSEELTFYSAIKEAMGEEDTKNKLNHAEHEHNEIEKFLDLLNSSAINNYGWLTTFKKLQEIVTHHVKEEENDIFSKARKCLTSKQSEELVKQMTNMKKEILVV